MTLACVRNDLGPCTRPARRSPSPFTGPAWVPQTWNTWNTQGLLWTWKTQGIPREFCASATSGKNCKKQSIFSSSFKYLARVCWLRWWPVILLELMWNDPWWRSLLHLLFVAITYGKVRLWLWKSRENSGNFFSYFVATLPARESPGPWQVCLICVVRSLRCRCLLMLSLHSLLSVLTTSSSAWTTEPGSTSSVRMVNTGYDSLRTAYRPVLFQFSNSFLF